MNGVRAKKKKIVVSYRFCFDRNNHHFSVRATDIGKSIRIEQNGKKQNETNRGRQLCRVDGEPCE